MLKLADFEGLDVGDQIEADPLFAGMSGEPIVLQVTKKLNSGRTKKFAVSYFKVTIGHWVCSVVEGDLVWTVE